MADIETKIENGYYFVNGMDSYSNPQALDSNTVVYSMNTTCRGGLYKTRPGSKSLLTISGDNPQGMCVFTPTGGVPNIVFAVDGLVYRSEYPFNSYSQIDGIVFAPHSRFISWTVAVKSTDYNADGELIFLDSSKSVLIMQDGITAAAYWDGGTARHLNPASTTNLTPSGELKPTVGYNETPVGLWSVWSGNRLWVARKNMVFASDIGNPLMFTDQLYLSEGRAFYLPGDCNGMIETPDQSGVLAFTRDNCTLFQSSISDRTKWLTTADFQKIVSPFVGCVAPRSLIQQYGLIWWFSSKGVMSLDSAFRTNQSSKISVQDMEMAASKRNICYDMAGICGISYENYLMLSVPYGDIYNRHTWVLDQDPFNQSTTNSWNSVWTGWRPVEWAKGNVFGADAVFFMSLDYDGYIRVWEAMRTDHNDNDMPITCTVQFREHNFGVPNDKKFGHVELDLREISGDVSMCIAYQGIKGGMSTISTKELSANSKGEMYGEVDYAGATVVRSLKAQSRFIISANASGSSECLGCNVESIKPQNIDKAFSIVVLWSGEMGINSYNLYVTNEPLSPQGNCEIDETGIKSLSENGCSAESLYVDTEPFDTYTATESVSIYCNDTPAIIYTGTATIVSYISQNDADRRAELAAKLNAIAEAGCDSYTVVT